MPTNCEEIELTSFNVKCELETSLSANTQDNYTTFTRSGKTIRHAIQNFNSPTTKKEIDEAKKVLLIRLEIEENFETFDSIKLSELADSCNKKSVVVIIATKEFEKFLLCWKTCEIDYFLILKPIQKKLKLELTELFKFLADFLIFVLNQGFLGLKKDCQFSKDSNEIDLTQLADQEDFSIFKLCAEGGEFKCVEILLQLNIFQDNPHDILNAQSRAQYNKHFDVLSLLIMNNYSYPLVLTEDEYPEKLKDFIKTSKDIHDAVIAKNLEKISTIVKQNPKVRHFYNKKNQSILKVALDRKYFNIYEILLASDVVLGPHEQFSEIFNNFSESEKTNLREIHFKYSKDLNENHMNVLMMNTQVSHDDTDNEGKEKLVHRAYSVLNKNPLTNPILKVVAASKYFGIIFDFKRSCVDILDPTAGSDTRGLFYVNGKICIGAKQLLDPSTEHETFGTLAHELCHYAINLTFKNFAKPYAADDRKSKNEFKTIRQFCKENSGKDEIIDLAFTYEQLVQSAELIVRPAHLIALYHNQPEKLAGIQSQFLGLFSYYIEKVIPAMEDAVPKIKVKKNKEIKEKDKKISKLTINLYIAIGLGILTTIFLSLFLYNPIKSYGKLTEEEKSTVKNSIVNYMNCSVRLMDLFPKNSTVYEHLTSEQIVHFLSSKNIVNFDDPQFYSLNRQLRFQWNNLTQILKEKVLNTNFNFQGEKVSYSSLEEACNKSCSYLTSKQIISILNGDEVFVGTKLIRSSYFYEERTFELENTSSRYTILAPEKSFKNFSEIVEQVLKLRMFVLSSEAGAGKTVNFEQLTIEMKKKFPAWWVSYIDLKGHTEHYKTSGRPNNVEEVLKKILMLNAEKNIFEVSVFEESFKSGTAVLIWNGFDEISPTYNDFVLNLLNLIYNNTSNIQFVCTRPIYSDQLSQAFKISNWKLVPLDEYTKIEFLRKYFTSQNSSSAEINKKIQKVHEILGKLKFKTEVWNRFKTPLMLILIAEIQNDENLLENLNIYSIYDKFVLRKIDIWMEKSKTALNKFVSNGNFKQISQKYALMSEFNLFSSTTLGLKLRKLDVITKRFPIGVTHVDISGMGILYINGKNKFEFAHKTFAEFFVAQYFIDNIHEFEGSMGEYEAELRIELFYQLVKQYEASQQIILDFILAYVHSHNNSDLFNSIISKLLKTKFRKFLKRMINFDNPNILDFPLNFFKKDHELLVSLMHVKDDETLYTSLFNPNYFALHIDHAKILNFAKNYLNVGEYNKFINGNNQKGKSLLGIIFYQSIGITKFYIGSNTELKSIGADYWKFFNNSKTLLTELEQKELFKTTLSPKIYLFYDKIFNSSDLNKYEEMWTNFEMLLSESEMRDAIGNALIDFFEINVNGNSISEFLLSFLLKKAKKFLSNQQIYEMFLTKNILHEAFWYGPYFVKLWNFLSEHTNENERKNILRKDDDDDNNFYFYYQNNKGLENYTSYDFANFGYDFTPFKIIHKSSFIANSFTFRLTLEIYKKHFNKTEILNIILSSEDFLYYVIGESLSTTSIRLACYLEELFEGELDSFKKLFGQEINASNMPIRPFNDIFFSLPYSRDLWAENRNHLNYLYCFKMKYNDQNNQTVRKFCNETYIVDVCIT